MVSALDSRSTSPALSPDQGTHSVVFSGKTQFTLTVHPLTQVFKITAGGNPAMEKHPILGE